MPANTFTWIPDISAAQDIKPVVEVAKYGDGYEQRVGIAINSMLSKWSLKFTGLAAATVNILAFLKARGGQESFIWTDPMNVTANYVCREWKSVQIKQSIYEVSCDFEQVPD